MSFDALVPDALLAGAIRRLAARYADVFPPAAVHTPVADSYLRLAAASTTVWTHLPLLAERFAAEGLDALAHTHRPGSGAGARVPFVRTANSARANRDDIDDRVLALLAELGTP